MWPVVVGAAEQMIDRMWVVNTVDVGFEYKWVMIEAKGYNLGD